MVRLESQPRGLQRRLEGQLNRFARQVARAALAKVAHEVQDALAQESGRSFDFKGTSSRRLMATGSSGGKTTFPFRLHSRSGRVVVEQRPAPLSRPYLADHTGGRVIGPRSGEAKRLRLGNNQLAIPKGEIADARRRSGTGRAGRVPKSMRPGALMNRKYIRLSHNRRALIDVRRHVVLYSFARRAYLRARFDFFGVGMRTVRLHLAAKLQGVLRTQRTLAGGTPGLGYAREPDWTGPWT